MKGKSLFDFEVECYIGKRGGRYGRKWGFSASTGTLYNGRRYWYLTLSFGRRTWWWQRWDVGRLAKYDRLYLSDGEMAWTRGIRT